MRLIAPCLSRYTMLYVRLALGITFLASVTDRFGCGVLRAPAMWPGGILTTFLPMLQR